MTSFLCALFMLFPAGAAEANSADLGASQDQWSKDTFAKTQTGAEQAKVRAFVEALLAGDEVKSDKRKPADTNPD